MTRLYQTHYHRLFRVFGIAMGVACLLGITSVPLFGAAILVSCALGWTYSGHRLAACGALTEGCTLTVRNPFSGPRMLESTDIERFELARWGLFPSMGYVVMKDGARIHIWGIRARNPAFVERDREVENLMRDLAEWLSRCSERPMIEGDGNEARAASD